jgi:ubiquinone/menaquinone biosynthesis C-methylase UbiE
MARMEEHEARYDRIAEAYARWWAPVHRPATLALLDEIAAAIDGGARTVLDIGCGTGAFLAAVVTRWPDVHALGVDVSDGMLQVADRELTALPGAARARIELRQGAADRLPVADGSVDVATSAFVYQLVPNRHGALLDVRRVLRPGGTLGFVTWLSGGRFGADEAYDGALMAAGLEPETHAADRDEPDHAATLAAQLRRAGFAGATARESELEHVFTPEEYLSFVARFDDADRFATLDLPCRQALETDLRARLHAMDADGLRMRLRVAYVRGRRTARP